VVLDMLIPGDPVTLKERLTASGTA